MSDLIIAKIAAGAKIQFASTGKWTVLEREQTATVLSEEYGVYRVQIHNRQFSVNYKYVSHA